MRAAGSRGGELALRVGSALVLVPLAIGTAYLGGWPFAMFWGLAAMGVLWEWTSLVARSDHRTVLMTGGASLALAVALVATGHLLAAVIVLAISALGVAALAPAKWRTWIAAGVPYAGALGVAPIFLRSDSADGFLAVIFLFAIVWTTDVVAYFSGRAIGGPKLMAQVSPKKTWSGAIAGTVGAMIAALLIASLFGTFNKIAILAVALILSVLAQFGDLFESWVKRQFGAKDSSQLIPGHGGVMDRLDGFWAAAVAGCLIGLVRGGFDGPARGLLLW